MESEQTALGCMIQDGTLAKETILQQECFQVEAHRLIFRAMRSLVEEGTAVDYVTITEKFGKHIGRIGGIEYLVKLSNSVPTTANFDHYERLLIEAWKKRQAVAITLTMKQQVEEEDSDEALPSAIRELLALEEYGHKQNENKRTTLSRLHEEIAKRDGKIRGARTGFKMYDRMTHGARPGQFIVLGARPAMGKTAWAVCASINMADSGSVPTLFSLEMGKEELYERAIASMARITSDKLQNPGENFNNDDWQRYNAAFGRLDGLALEIEDKAGVNVAYIRSVMRRRIKEQPNRQHVCIIDYLQLIRGNKRDRQEEVSEISRSLKEMARDLKIPVIALSQLSRELEKRHDKRPIMSDLRESGSIEQDADIVAFLYRDAYYNPETEHKTLVELIVSKQRGGKTGTVPLQFLGDYTLMIDVPEVK